jgi:hypothetical protein
VGVEGAGELGRLHAQRDGHVRNADHADPFEYPDADLDPDAVPDVDENLDSQSDRDADADENLDSQSDRDADAYPARGVIAYSDSDQNSYSNAHCHSDSDSDVDFHSVSNRHAFQDADSDEHRHRHTAHSDRDCHPDHHVHALADSDAHENAHADRDANEYADGSTSHSDVDLDADENAYPDPDAHADTDADADPTLVTRLLHARALSRVRHPRSGRTVWRTAALGRAEPGVHDGRTMRGPAERDRDLPEPHDDRRDRRGIPDGLPAGVADSPRVDDQLPSRADPRQQRDRAAWNRRGDRDLLRPGFRKHGRRHRGSERILHAAIRTIVPPQSPAPSSKVEHLRLWSRSTLVEDNEHFSLTRAQERA